MKNVDTKLIGLIHETHIMNFVNINVENSFSFLQLFRD